MRGRSGLILTALAASSLLVLSAAMAFQEARPFLLRGQPAGVRIAAARAAADSSPVSRLESMTAQVARLDLCTNALREIAATTAGTPSLRREIARGCLNIAKAIVARSPLQSNVWFVAAVLLTRLGDLKSAERYLEASYLTGPDEQWIAERRSLFFYPLRRHFGSGISERIDQDLALLLRTERGLDSLASLYVADAGMREHLTAIVERLDDTVQKRFLDRVRDQAQVAR